MRLGLEKGSRYKEFQMVARFSSGSSPSQWPDHFVGAMVQTIRRNMFSTYVSRLHCLYAIQASAITGHCNNAEWDLAMVLNLYPPALSPQRHPELFFDFQAHHQLRHPIPGFQSPGAGYHQRKSHLRCQEVCPEITKIQLF